LFCAFADTARIDADLGAQLVQAVPAGSLSGQVSGGLHDGPGGLPYLAYLGVDTVGGIDDSDHPTVAGQSHAVVPAQLGEGGHALARSQRHREVRGRGHVATLYISVHYCNECGAGRESVAYGIKAAVGGVGVLAA
jgi:hypothetical protein